MSVTDRDRTADREAVLAVLAALVHAWDHNDADAYGALFSRDASYTTFVGTVYLGREAITESHRALFGKFLKDTKLADNLVDLRFYGTDTAVAVTRGDTYKGDTPSVSRKVQVHILVREADQGWQIAAFQNTTRRPLMEKIMVRMLPATAGSV